MGNKSLNACTGWTRTRVQSCISHGSYPTHQPTPPPTYVLYDIDYNVCCGRQCTLFCRGELVFACIRACTYMLTRQTNIPLPPPRSTFYIHFVLSPIATKTIFEHVMIYAYYSSNPPIVVDYIQYCISTSVFTVCMDLVHW